VIRTGSPLYAQQLPQTLERAVKSFPVDKHGWLVAQLK
jgi:hypothetical protein